VDDIKDPLDEAIKLVRRFYTDVWFASGRQVADEVARDNAGNVSFEYFICSCNSCTIILRCSTCVAGSQGC
jgi:hypothetical protein